MMSSSKISYFLYGHGVGQPEHRLDDASKSVRLILRDLEDLDHSPWDEASSGSLNDWQSGHPSYWVHEWWECFKADQSDSARARWVEVDPMDPNHIQQVKAVWGFGLKCIVDAQEDVCLPGVSDPEILKKMWQSHEVYLEVFKQELGGHQELADTLHRVSLRTWMLGLFEEWVKAGQGEWVQQQWAQFAAKDVEEQSKVLNQPDWLWDPHTMSSVSGKGAPWLEREWKGLSTLLATMMEDWESAQGVSNRCKNMLLERSPESPRLIWALLKTLEHSTLSAQQKKAWFDVWFDIQRRHEAYGECPKGWLTQLDSKMVDYFKQRMGSHTGQDHACFAQWAKEALADSSLTLEKTIEEGFKKGEHVQATEELDKWLEEVSEHRLWDLLPPRILNGSAWLLPYVQGAVETVAPGPSLSRARKDLTNDASEVLNFYKIPLVKARQLDWPRVLSQFEDAFFNEGLFFVNLPYVKKVFGRPASERQAQWEAFRAQGVPMKTLFENWVFQLDFEELKIPHQDRPSLLPPLEWQEQWQQCGDLREWLKSCKTPQEVFYGFSDAWSQDPKERATQEVLIMFDVLSQSYRCGDYVSESWLDWLKQTGELLLGSCMERGWIFVAQEMFRECYKAEKAIKVIQHSDVFLKMLQSMPVTKEWHRHPYTWLLLTPAPVLNRPCFGPFHSIDTMGQHQNWSTSSVSEVVGLLKTKGFDVSNFKVPSEDFVKWLEKPESDAWRDVLKTEWQRLQLENQLTLTNSNDSVTDSPSSKKIRL